MTSTEQVSDSTHEAPRICALVFELDPRALEGMGESLRSLALCRLNQIFPELPAYVYPAFDRGDSRAKKSGKQASRENANPKDSYEPVFRDGLFDALRQEGKRTVKLLSAGHWKEALDAVFEDQQGHDYDSVACFEGLYPLLDEELCAEISKQHLQYLAHVTYGENLPAGLVPDLVARDFLRRLPASASFDEGPRALAFKNVEIFDIELFYRMPDLRPYRLDLSGRNARSVRLLEDLSGLLLESGEKKADKNESSVFSETAQRHDTPDAGKKNEKNKEKPVKSPNSFHEATILKKIRDALQRRPALFLRPFPACFEVELCGRAEVESVYRLPCVSGDLEWGLYQKLLSEIAADGLRNDATVILGGSGDAFLYSNIVEAVESTLANPNVKGLIVETYLTSLPEELYEFLRGVHEPDRLHLIVRLGSTNEDIWKNLHRPSRFKKAPESNEGETQIQSEVGLSDVLQNLRRLDELLVSDDEAGFSCYAEALRMNENEAGIDEFMAYFSDLQIQPLLGKYNSWLGELPDRRAVDLTPLSRSFCWHLARDFYLNAQGLVSFCKQDPKARKAPFWDFRRFGIQKIWDEGLGFFEASFRGDHEALPLPCRECDEWYTFNA